MDDGKKVWVPHPTEGFILGRIIDIGADTITVEPFKSRQVRFIVKFTWLLRKKAVMHPEFRKAE